MTLARERGLSVSEVQQRTDADEFAEWLAFQEVDPASEERADFRTAVIAAVIANLFRGKGGKAVSPIDFMPYTEKPKRSNQDIENDILSWGRAMKAKQDRMKAKRG